MPIFRTLALAAGLALPALAASAADAPPSPVAKAFKSTIVSTYPDGRIAKLWMKPDGTYVSQGRRHEYRHGRWSLKGEKVCFKRGIFGYCTQMPTDAAFTTKAVTGETIQVRLVPGREGESAG